MNSLIRPVYFVDPALNCIQLGTAPIEIVDGQKNISGHGIAKLRLRPDLQLSTDIHFSDADGDTLSLKVGSTVGLIFGQKSERANATVKSINTQMENSKPRIDVRLIPNPQRLIFRNDPATETTCLIFHIINFPQFFNFNEDAGDLRHQTQSGGKRLGRVILNSREWTIEIQELPEAKDVITQLQETGGYGITHVGQLTKKDGRSFTTEAAQIAIQNLYLFLSFARGAWTPPVLTVGYSATGSKTFEDWGIRMSTPWESRQGWFDVHNAAWLPILYPKFLSLIHHRALGKAVTNAIYWYLRSNRGGNGAGVDSGIILSQAALERLSAAYLKNIKAEKSKNANAAQALRDTLDHLNIPQQIPAGLAELIEGQQRGLWNDAPEAITRIRNELVHPKGKLSIKIGRVIPDTWRLAQWYIELILLRLSNYNGCYSNRLTARWIGEIENVPWTNSSPRMG